MKRMTVLLLSLVLLPSLSLQAKTGGVLKDANPPTPVTALPFYTACMAKITLSTEQKATYNKIKAFLPDIFCCSKQDAEEQAACRSQNISLLNNFSVFFEQSVNNPLFAKLFPNYSGDSDLDTFGLSNSDVEKILFELNRVGSMFDKYQSLVEQAD